MKSILPFTFSMVGTYFWIYLDFLELPDFTVLPYSDFLKILQDNWIVVASLIVPDAV